MLVETSQQLWKAAQAVREILFVTSTSILPGLSNEQALGVLGAIILRDEAGDPKLQALPKARPALPKASTRQTRSVNDEILLRAVVRDLAKHPEGKRMGALWRPLKPLAPNVLHFRSHLRQLLTEHKDLFSFRSGDVVRLKKEAKLDRYLPPPQGEGLPPSPESIDKVPATIAFAKEHPSFTAAELGRAQTPPCIGTRFNGALAQLVAAGVLKKRDRSYLVVEEKLRDYTP